MGLTSCILRNYPVIEQTGDLSAIHHSNSLKKIVLDIFKLNVRNGKNKLFLPTSHLFVNLVERNAVQKQVLNPTRDTEDTKESHHCYQWTCHHHNSTTIAYIHPSSEWHRQSQSEIRRNGKLVSFKCVLTRRRYYF